MLPQIHQARILSAKLRCLIKAKQNVTEALYVYLRGDIFLSAPLKEALARLEGKILLLRDEIESNISSIPGYNREIHWKISYIDQVDIKEGSVDLSPADGHKWILNLETGDIICIESTEN